MLLQEDTECDEDGEPISASGAPQDNKIPKRGGKFMEEGF